MDTIIGLVLGIASGYWHVLIAYRLIQFYSRVKSEQVDDLVNDLQGLLIALSGDIRTA